MNRRKFIHLAGSSFALPFVHRISSLDSQKYIRPPGSYFTVYKHKDFGSDPINIDVDAKVLNQVYAFRRSEFANEISSLKWELKDSKRLILYSEVEGQGKRYSVERSGEDRNLSRSDFNDMASSYRVIKDGSIPQHFDNISTRRHVLSFANRGFLKGTDRGFWNGHQEHFQGVQLIDNNHIIITTSDFKGAYFFIVKWENGIFSGTSGSVLEEVFIKEDYPDFTFNHCSGIQLLNKVAAIGLEYIGNKPEANKPRSAVVFYDLANPARPRKLGNPIVRQHNSTGTVGITFTKENHIIMVVGGTHTLDLDFYITRRDHQNTITNETEFGSPVKWKWQITGVLPVLKGKPANGDTRGWVDDRWGHFYQSLNLLRDFDGELYLVGFNKSGDSNWVDLYTINLSGGNIYLKKISKKKVYCREGVKFEFASGIYNQGRKLGLIATGDGRSKGEWVNLNYFRRDE